MNQNLSKIAAIGTLSLAIVLVSSVVSWAKQRKDRSPASMYAPQQIVNPPMTQPDWYRGPGNVESALPAKEADNRYSLINKQLYYIPGAGVKEAPVGTRLNHYLYQAD